MDKRLVEAIGALEIYHQMYLDTGMISRAKIAAETIQNLKVCAFDSYDWVDQNETRSVTEPDEDFGPLIPEPAMSPDEMVCNGILKNIVDKTPLFVWYSNRVGAHTVWTSKLLNDRVGTDEETPNRRGVVQLYDEDGYNPVAVSYFDGDIILFMDQEYQVDCEGE